MVEVVLPCDVVALVNKEVGLVLLTNADLSVAQAKSRVNVKWLILHRVLGDDDV